MRPIQVGHIIALMTVVSLAATSTARATTILDQDFENNLLDSSGNSNNASATGTSFSTNIFGSPVPRTGSPNTRSLELANTAGNTQAVDYLTVAHDSSLNLAGGSFTIEGWVQLDEFASTSTRRYYLTQKKDIGDTDDLASYTFIARMGNIGVEADRQKLAFEMGDGSGGTQRVVSNLFINDSDWHHISVALDGTNGNVRFTLDDQTADTHAAAINTSNLFDNSDLLYIGAHPTPPNAALTTVNHGFDGRIDELRISNVFLPESQLLAVPEPATVNSAAAAVIVLCSFLAWAARRRRLLNRPTLRRHRNAK